jgi:hypothetical protein
VREPLKRQITIALASPSGALPSAHPVNAIDPTARPCHSPMAPSLSITTKLSQANRRAHRALRCHPASRVADTGEAWVDPSQQASSPGSTESEVVAVCISRC